MRKRKAILKNVFNLLKYIIYRIIASGPNRTLKTNNRQSIIKHPIKMKKTLIRDMAFTGYYFKAMAFKRTEPLLIIDPLKSETEILNIRDQYMNQIQNIIVCIM